MVGARAVGAALYAGYGVAEVTRSTALSRETQLEIVYDAFQQMRPLEDDGILHGLPILLSSLAGAGVLDVNLFASAMQLADIQGHLFDDWQAAEAQHLLDWLIAKSGVPEAERLWWVWYVLAHCDRPDLGRALMRFLRGASRLASGDPARAVPDHSGAARQPSAAR